MFEFMGYATGLVAIYMVYNAIRPLVEGGVVTADDWQRIEDESMALLTKRDRIVEELRDLEFEAALDKIDQGDLAEMRARFEAEAVAVVRTLDQRAEGYEGRIEAEVQARLDSASAKRAARDAGPVEVETPQKTEPAKESTDKQATEDPPSVDSLSCPTCDEGIESDAKFCDACGTALKVSCRACQAENRAEARFCKGCGESLKTPDEGETV